jgi:hypothetical protein
VDKHDNNATRFHDHQTWGLPVLNHSLVGTESYGQKRDCSRTPRRSRVGPVARTKYEFDGVNSPAPFLVWPHFVRVQTGLHRKASEPSKIRANRQPFTGSPKNRVDRCRSPQTGCNLLQQGTV